MIRHIVFFTAAQEQRQAVYDGLCMLKQIPHAARLEITFNSKIDLYANDVDIIVYGEFKDRAAFDAYKADPIYHACTAKVKPMREMRFAADYETAGV